MWEDLLLIQVTKEMFPFHDNGETSQLCASSSPSQQEVQGGYGDANFPGELPSCRLIQNSLWCLRLRLLCRGGEWRNRAQQELREPPGHQEGLGLCRAAALRGDRWPELLLFNVLPPWHCPDRKWGREPVSKSCILSVTEKNS